MQERGFFGVFRSHDLRFSPFFVFVSHTLAEVVLNCPRFAWLLRVVRARAVTPSQSNRGLSHETDRLFDLNIGGYSQVSYIFPLQCPIPTVATVRQNNVILCIPSAPDITAIEARRRHVLVGYRGEGRAGTGVGCFHA